MQTLLPNNYSRDSNLALRNEEVGHEIDTIFHVIIKIPYNAHSDWLKQRALSENKARVDDGKLAFEFVIRNFDKFDPN